ncbi:hypothetical protein [Marinimicrobium sp. ABcell2]|uniref:hypothetical protein n=1 Tax=Marinimicrobium sp. ABcell2 TaxID=3069751 RepID=UPI0027B4277C|nr:hypothetical protein [Marinimicrobium sp. ABcell2]MDQ2077944.1 hypothetical protein [Marinimicrobium sp. ABcell2]
MWGQGKRLRPGGLISLALLCLALMAAPGQADTLEQSPFTVNLQKNITEDRVHYQLLVHADSDQVSVADTTLVAHIRNSAGFSAVHTLPLDDQNRWHLTLSPEEPARYRIDLEVSGKTPNQEPLRLSLDSQYFQFPEPGDPYTSPEERALAALMQGLEQDAEEPSVPLPEPVTPVERTSAPSAPPSNDGAMQAVTRVLIYGSVLVANLLVLALIAFGYRMFMNSKDDEDADVFEDSESPPELEQGGVAMPPMQDIDSDESNEPPEDEAEPPPDAEMETESESEPEYQDADEPLFPLDEDDWASAELDEEESDAPPEQEQEKDKP